MKKYINFTILFVFLLLILLSTNCFAIPKPKDINIDVNDINLDSISEDKIDDLKEVLETVDVKSLSTSAKDIAEDVKDNKTSTSDVDFEQFIGVYDKLSTVISNEEIADLIEDNNKVLTDVGVSKEALSLSETMLRTFDADTVIDIARNDIDINKLINMYKNGASLTDILKTINNDISTGNQIKIIFKLLFSNKYVRIACFVLIIVAIYSIFITSIIFGKAGKKKFRCNYSNLSRYCSFTNMWFVSLVFNTYIYTNSWLAYSYVYCDYW